MDETSRMKKLLDLLVFKNLPIKKKFLLFSIGTLFWFIIVSAIGLVTMFEMNAKSQRIVDVIEPQQRTGHVVVRKLRGISISAHKILIAETSENINPNYLKAMARVEDVRSYLNTLLHGGRIKDYSRGTGQFYSDFNVAALSNDEMRGYVQEMLNKIELLEDALEQLTDAKIKSNKSALAWERLSDIDGLTRETITIANKYIISLDKEWSTFSSIIKTRLGLSIVLTIVIFFLATIISGVFGTLIARSLSKPVSRLNEQIKALSVGEVDLTKKLAVTSHDEIGDLTKEFNKLMDTINNVTNFKKVIEEDESLQDIYLRLGKVFIEYLRLDSCVIYESSDNSNNMRVVFPPDAEGIELNCRKDIYSDCNLCRAKRTGHLVSTIDYPDVCKYFLEGSGKSHVCLPIIVGGTVSGVVQIVCKKAEVCSLMDIRNKVSRAEQYIREVQPVLEAKKLMKALKDSAVKDVLTGLYNRRFIEESYEKLVAGIIRRGSTIGLLMCDIDFFKQTNDLYGHDAGDAVLKAASNAIKGAVRAADMVVRFGGEEFLVLVVDAKQGNSVAVAEKIRERVSEIKVQVRTEVIQKTISIGVSEFPVDTENFWEAIKYADVALYKAKTTGRNKVVRFEMAMWGEEKY